MLRQRKKFKHTHSHTAANRAHYIKRAVERWAPQSMLDVEKVKQLILANTEKGRQLTNTRYFFKFHSERERSYWVVVFSFRLKVPVTIYCDDEESPDYRDMELITVDKLIPEGEETT